MIMVKGLRAAHTLLGNNNKKRKINTKRLRECLVDGGTLLSRVPTYVLCQAGYAF